MDQFGSLLDILNLSEEVRALDVQASAGLFVQLSGNLGKIGLAVLDRNHYQLMTGSPAVGFDDADVVRMSSFRTENNLTAALAAHIDRFSSGGSTVVDRSVGNIHAGQLADHGLIFKDRLQDALADFSLIGSVCSDKFLFAGDAFNDRRNVMIVSAGAAED